MPIENVRAFFSNYDLADRIQEFDTSLATAEMSANALGCELKQIAKTLSFLLKKQDKAILIVASGDKKVDNKKFKARFNERPLMVPAESAMNVIGHEVGAICPFVINDGVEVYLDDSIKRVDTVFIACGSTSAIIELSLEELETYSGFLGWVDVCKD